MFKPLLAAACCAWAGAAAAEPLTLADALARAAKGAPSVKAARLQVDASRTFAKAAGELPDPKVSVGVTDFPISGPLMGRPDLDNFSMVTLGYSQDVPNRAKRHVDGAERVQDRSVAEQRLLRV